MVNKKRLFGFLTGVVGLAVAIGVASFGVYQFRRAEDLNRQLDSQYNRAFYDMTGYVNNVEKTLLKSRLTTTNGKTAYLLSEAWRQANMAQENLGMLPISQPVLANTSKFLTQVGDIAYALNNQSVEGKAISEEQNKMLEQLHGIAVTLGESLFELQNQIDAGGLKWSVLAKQGTKEMEKASEKMPKNQFDSIEKNFQDYPKLIYDGPFSEHMLAVEPRGLTGDIIGVDAAKEKVKLFFGADKVKDITENGKFDGGPINTYMFKVTFKNAPEDQFAQIEITQKGGHPYMMLYNRNVVNDELDMEKAKQIGKQFLDAQGYKNMVDTYFLKEDNTAVINYAYKQDNVVVYSDLIKVKVALDNGEIVGIESKTFLSAHMQRKLAKPKITEQQAREVVNKEVIIAKSGLAVIPTNFKTEIFCYEFKGKYKDKDFLVYVNVETGKEEDMLMIIDTPNGVLTM